MRILVSAIVAISLAGFMTGCEFFKTAEQDKEEKAQLQESLIDAVESAKKMEKDSMSMTESVEESESTSTEEEKSEDAVEADKSEESKDDATSDDAAKDDTAKAE